MADDLRVNGWLVIPAGELRERFSRSSGPGGQSVNTADSRVELSYDVASSPALPAYARERILTRLGGRLTDGVLTVTASEQRSQLQNRRAARGRMANLLREALAPPEPPRIPTRPSRGARERRLADKRRRSAVKRSRRPDPVIRNDGGRAAGHGGVRAGSRRRAPAAAHAGGRRLVPGAGPDGDVRAGPRHPLGLLRVPARYRGLARAQPRRAHRPGPYSSATGTTMASCVERAITTTASVSGEGFSSRCGTCGGTQT